MQFMLRWTLWETYKIASPTVAGNQILYSRDSIQRLLHTWTSRLGTFFPTFVKVKISKDDSDIICRSSRNITFPKMWRVWLKNWTCHAHLKFKIGLGVAGSIFEPHPWIFAKLLIFQRSSNDISIFFWNFWWFLVYKKAA